MRRFKGSSFGANSEQCAIDTKPEAYATQILSTKFGHQSVVSSTSANTRLGAQEWVYEFESCASVVIKPAHHFWCDRVRNL